jgi:hypothetical protein
MLIHRSPGWRFRTLQFAVLALVLVGMRQGLGDGFAFPDRGVAITAVVSEAWNGTFRAIRRQVDRLGLPV